MYISVLEIRSPNNNETEAKYVKRMSLHRLAEHQACEITDTRILKGKLKEQDDKALLAFDGKDQAQFELEKNGVRVNGRLWRHVSDVIPESFVLVKYAFEITDVSCPSLWGDVLQGNVGYHPCWLTPNGLRRCQITTPAGSVTLEGAADEGSYSGYFSDRIRYANGTCQRI